MLVIKDANIFIDLYEIDLLHYLLKLDMEICMTDFVVEMEIVEADQQKVLKTMIRDEHIQVTPANENDVREIIGILNQESSRLSIQDCSNLYFAKKKQAILMTNDKLLRKTSIRHQVKVHGIIWLFDMWVKHKILDKEIAAEKLKLLWKKNNWLPYEEMKKRISEWSGGRLSIG